MSGVEVIIEDLSAHPSCVHGPTLLFSREIDGHKRFYYACSACRDRKKCSFFVWQDELEKYVNKKINRQIVDHNKFINHRSLFLKLNEVRAVSEERRIYCKTCNLLDIEGVSSVHEEHDVKKGVTDYELEHPSEFLTPLDDSKNEAQYLFSKKCVGSIIEMLQHLGKKNVICIGTPRIFEYINSDINLGMNAILLDFDSRYNSFFGPLQFCWYNMFNNHFFKSDGKDVFKDFLKSTNVSDTILITDPPFGGRVEPIADTFNNLNGTFKKVHKTDQDLPMFWIFPYFMEPYIMNSMENFSLLDYKVDYENHPLFQGKGGRKFGSPVRIFTNLQPSSITLPVEEGYKYCSICEKWVSEENKHCDECGVCTSKDGRTYIHCIICEKCVKPNWIHCKKCRKCAIETHKCEQLPFTKTCLNCKQPGHKKMDCPDLKSTKLMKEIKLKPEVEEGLELEEDTKETKSKLAKKRKFKPEVNEDLELGEVTQETKSKLTKKRKLKPEAKEDLKFEEVTKETKSKLTKKRKLKPQVKEDLELGEVSNETKLKLTKKRKLKAESKEDLELEEVTKEIKSKLTKKRKLKPESKEELVLKKVTKKTKSNIVKRKNKAKKLKK